MLLKQKTNTSTFNLNSIICYNKNHLSSFFIYYTSLNVNLSYFQSEFYTYIQECLGSNKKESLQMQDKTYLTSQI